MGRNLNGSKKYTTCINVCVYLHILTEKPHEEYFENLLPVKNVAGFPKW